MHPLRFPNSDIRAKGRAAIAKAPLQRGGHPRARPAAASPAASKGGGAGHMGGRPLAGRLPTAKGSRRLRRGSGGGSVLRMKEG
ncbi:hypothetical protein GW17_00059237 [Ensete ventricosum]|nr:hypothetical protein GW17_00059237 [Ensete ventricosum]RZS01413.1 hypothetical protein BHM03_00031260 [Ensete ventricosum]